jgi:hypothetical protein
MPRPIQTLTLADARTLIAGAENQAVELGLPYDVAVADAAVAALKLT